MTTIKNASLHDLYTLLAQHRASGDRKKAIEVDEEIKRREKADLDAFVSRWKP